MSISFLAALLAYCEENISPFHTPGHKQGRGMALDFQRAWQQWGLKLDIDPPVLVGSEGATLPLALLAEAESKAAELFGGKATFFLTNGTTAGIQSMFLGAIKDRKVIIPRHIHYSVLGALILSGADPVILPPKAKNSELPDSRLTPEQVQQVLSSDSEIAGVFTQNPTYFGFADDLQDLIHIAHAEGIPVLVDEAHGPHFAFSSELPPTALSQGADLVAQSTHKLLTSLTGSSMLHLGGALIDPEEISRYVEITQSTSPSFLLLASLESAVYQLAADGQGLVTQVLELAYDLRRQLAEVQGIKVYGSIEAQAEGYPYWDPTKVVIDFSPSGLGGVEALNILREEYKIQGEMADFSRVLLVLGPGDDRDSIACLKPILTDLVARYKRSPGRTTIPLPGYSSQQVLTPREAYFAPGVTLSLKESIGKVAAQLVAPYPPGIPILIPGEVITVEQIEYLKELACSGFQVTGLTEQAEIRVVK